MTVARWGVSILLGLFLIVMGVMKFTGAHIFQYIEFKSGIDLFHPLVNIVVGLAEIGAGAMILLPATRAIGSIMGLGVIGGAIVFHLSPWLGVATPTGFAPGAAAPWDAADFTTDTSTALFMAAVVMFLVAASNVALHRGRVRALLGRPSHAGA